MIVSLRDALGGALDGAGLETASDAWRIADVWCAVVGEGIAARATPARLTRGELLVAVPEAVWRQELSLLTPDIKTKLNQALGREVVIRIRLVGGAPTGPRQPRLEGRPHGAAAGHSNREARAGGPAFPNPAASAPPPPPPATGPSPPADSAPTARPPASSGAAAGIQEALEALGRRRADRLARDRAGGR